jgi:cytochrome c-type biogenesis protein
MHLPGFHRKSPKKQKFCLTKITSQSLNSIPSIFINQKTVENSKMSLMPGITSPYLGAFVGGLFYGSVFCTASCIPYIASYIAGIGAGFRRSIGITLLYNGGRVTAYALIGGAVGILSGAFRLFVSEDSLLPFQMYSSIAFGVVTIAIGAAVLLRKQPSCNRSLEQKADLDNGPSKGRFDVGAFSLGLSRGLVICTPLVALLVTSIAFAAPIDSFFLAVLFGVGTALSPILLLGGVTGWLLSKAPLLRRWISIGGAGILILLGSIQLITAILTLNR